MSEKSSKINAVSVTNLLASIKYGEYKVPMFQRKIAWDKNRVIDFYNSLINNEPFGFVMIWNTDINVDEFNDIIIHYRDTNNLNNVFNYIIDGQQRLTTIVSLFFKNSKLPLIEKGNEFGKFYNMVNKNIGFDLQKLKFASIDKRNKYIVPVNKLFSEDLTKTDIQNEIKNLYVNDEYAEVYLELQDIISKIKNSNVGIIELKGQSLEEVIDIFTNINTKGKKLTVGDIIHSKWHSVNINLLEYHDNLVESLKEYKAGYDEISLDVLIDTIYSVISYQPIIENKRKLDFGLENLSNNELDPLINLVVESIKNAVKELVNFTISYKNNISEIVIKWLAYYFFKSQKSSMSELTRKNVYKYIFLTALNSRYKSSTNDKFKTDLEFVNQVLINNQSFEVFIDKNKNEFIETLIDEQLYYYSSVKGTDSLSKFIKSFILDNCDKLSIQCELPNIENRLLRKEVRFNSASNLEDDDLFESFGNAIISDCKIKPFLDPDLDKVKLTNNKIINELNKLLD